MKTENESCALVMAMKCSNLAARIVLSAMECMDPMGDTGSSPPIPPQELLQLWDSPSSIEDGKPLPVPPPEIESHAERMPVTPPELLNGDYIDLSTPPTDHQPFTPPLVQGPWRVDEVPITPPEMDGFWCQGQPVPGPKTPPGIMNGGSSQHISTHSEFFPVTPTEMLGNVDVMNMIVITPETPVAPHTPPFSPPLSPGTPCGSPPLTPKTPPCRSPDALWESVELMEVAEYVSSEEEFVTPKKNGPLRMKRRLDEMGNLAPAKAPRLAVDQVP